MHNCRALLDPGPQSSFITTEMCRLLNLSTTNVNIHIKGINQRTIQIKSRTSVRIHSMYTNFQTTVHCLVLDKITENLPSISFSSSMIRVPRNLRLADPKYNVSSNIDILLGTKTFWQLLCVGQIKIGKNLPNLQKTRLGWVVAGDLPLNNLSLQQSFITSQATTEALIHQQISRFWEMEELCNTPSLSQEEQYCESHFAETTARAADGRFIVKIPLRENHANLGESRHLALKRFSSLDRKLSRNPDLREAYVNFMNEYEVLGHMTRIKEQDNQSDLVFYFPHHPVIKESSATTKLRVVFDGSARTDSSLSLNSFQMVGPTIQQDLFSTLLRFRRHVIAITADITNMYTQVLVSTSQRSLQRIFWRSSPAEEIASYELNTITYGSAAASFLAIRCLKQLAIETKSTFPVASSILENDFYVDDMLTGGDSREQVLRIRDELIHILRTAGIELNKWASNDESALSGLSTDQANSTLIQLSENPEIKTLGVPWNSHSYVFLYSAKSFNVKRITKRTILLTIGHIYDPLGLIAPVTIMTKVSKSYVCVFVSFATEALHVELVCDLTTSSFIAALRRFASRRGRPAHIYSDNGSNFVGAKSELTELLSFIKDPNTQKQLSQSAINDGINWHFIPPRSPHFGGLWEAGVKSIKLHLKRVVANACLSYEEFGTYLTQIEGKHKLSNDPNDLEPLTPAHFLTGRTLTGIPDPNLLDVPENRLCRFQRIQQLSQHFWKRWSREYLSELQQRVKWKQGARSIQPNDMVLIREDNLPPIRWQLGRVMETHPGQDGIVRVATVKVINGLFKRAVAKLCVLPESSEH